MDERLTYAIGDIHGRLDLLMDLLSQIITHANGRSCKLVFLGDYIDRGPDSAGVLALVRRFQQHWPESVICLKGNHEAMLLEVVTEPAVTSWWLGNGGDTTLASFGVSHPGDLPADVLSWIAGLPTLYEDEHRYFVHAGRHPDLRLSEQDDQTKLWIRGEFLLVDYNFGKHVVHGHMPSETGCPEVRPYRTNLDTGAVFSSPLTAGVFADERGPAVAFLRSPDG
ncbi:metallophosphoesterase family protein [Microvirga tunisiensis]|uniref:Serine/threonine protein phosphatase n=1 Tax=Microvirga tunisiensis TaxID=2108360 RepID=A0A5N7MRI9_9HYPH|nr:metallophosphoesterase family protein [Microvirga tunisiensis]MPR11603.1 serine/threonine protein phosphatase [Microvirga tunisiensis]MPR29607.1 serine/threonine protein phosphatase [Microvirga tunisiensis]